MCTQPESLQGDRHVTRETSMEEFPLINESVRKAQEERKWNRNNQTENKEEQD